ncbi:hypothetical protein LTR62_008261 [Meristemomyces frigidus]|uniref:Xylanolytic transcriptional activator regulatory domain-containing protein n=1 Tax=Meristemomyces frigidus TaxID=1508187 RepID=A0AAN7TB37_9PEZI|nr:hypothetical protein LTR62_008261 [Meristemomyces frigidus]
MSPTQNQVLRETAVRIVHTTWSVRFSQDYIRDLQRRVAAAEQGGSPAGSSPPPLHTYNDGSQPLPGRVEDQEEDRASAASEQETEPPARTKGTGSTHGQRLINNFATGKPFYVPDAQGKAIYLGTSSTWSFGRRVLLLAQERIVKAPLSPHQLLWQGQAYKLAWNGERSLEATSAFGDALVPQADYGIYLVNAVKFHACQLFHLFDETTFMERFTQFYDPAADSQTTNSLWYTHYLLILAFGKAFVSRENLTDRGPPGLTFFLQAMVTLPDLTCVTLSSLDVLEAMEILCCAALYLHSLDFRAAAYRQIGMALRLALEQGLHTDMEHQHNPEHTLERPRRIWWTVLLLDRQMSSLMGVPLALRDEEISAKLPTYGSSVSKVRALDLHVRLSSILAVIVTNLYGKDGRNKGKFLVHTKAALNQVAKMTEELNDAFSLPVDDPVSISRVSAYLHLMLHQCIVLATRPILFSYLESRLLHEEGFPRGTRPAANVWALLHMCRDSATHMLRILQVLKEQGLLESFLPFDLDATYTSAIVAQIAAHIDAPLLEDAQPLNKMAYECLDEMASRGNQIAKKLKVELQRLEMIFARLPRRSEPAQRSNLSDLRLRPLPDDTLNNSLANLPARTEPLPATGTDPPTDPATNGSLDWFADISSFENPLNAPHMASVAESIDLDGLEWWFSSNPDFAGQGLEL